MPTSARDGLALLAASAASSDAADELQRESSGAHRARTNAFGQVASHEHTPAAVLV